jgi:aminopeptidase N
MDKTRMVAVALAAAGCLAISGCFGSGESGGPGGSDGSNAATTSDQTEPPELASVPGDGIGDPYYPDDGNRGYDVRHYAVDLDYFPDRQAIRATTTVVATSAAQLDSFDLDLLGMTVTDVTVDGRHADFKRVPPHELVITPGGSIASGSRFVTRVSYHGRLGADLGDQVDSGWFDADTPGGGFIAGEPHSCTIWYPCNDHPTDKATFELRATVPRPFSVVSNGAELATTSATQPDGTRVRTFHWRLDAPTATYLTTVYIDKLRIDRSTLPDGTPVVSAYGPSPGAAPAREAKLPEILDMLSSYWGPYPAPQAGGIFVNGDIDFSLETYTRPTYVEGVDVSTIVHENAHQWWGDNVSIKRWRDICLNECLATYSQWLWAEHNGADLDQYYRANVSDDPKFFDFPLYDMGPGHEFDFDGVYTKGSFFIHALRRKLGDDAFFTAMREIQAEDAGGNLSMNDLRSLLEDKTGVDLDSFWDEWVLSTGVPSDENLYPGDLSDE